MDNNIESIINEVAWYVKSRGLNSLYTAEKWKAVCDIIRDAGQVNEYKDFYDKDDTTVAMNVTKYFIEKSYTMPEPRVFLINLIRTQATSLVERPQEGYFRILLIIYYLSVSL